jgi:tetratricopeptide (TPR) repeat protein
VRLEPANAVAWRNLGIGYYNILGQPARARRAYAAAFHADPTDARLLFERDQLWKRLGTSPARRLRELAQHPVLVARRDDLSIELCALYNQTGQPAKALAIVSSRKFQPWEGGEGQALGQHVRTHVLLGRAALARGDAPEARRLFASALASPPNLGEAKHLLANQSDLHFWLGEACTAAGDRAAAKTHWHTAAKFQGDFQEMSVRAFSEMTYYSALALARLGRKTQARQLLRDLLGHARSLAKAGAKIDYFATSLPTMLLFDEDLPARQRTTAKFLEAQARLGLGQPVVAHRLLASILRRAPNHALAADLLAR